jgi:hypothetical protein
VQIDTSRAPSSWARRSAAMTFADGSCSGSATLGTITVPASPSTSRPCGVCSVAPPITRTGSGVSAQMVSRYQGTSISGQAIPNTSVTMPVSKADIPS